MCNANVPAAPCVQMPGAACIFDGALKTQSKRAPGVLFVYSFFLPSNQTKKSRSDSVLLHSKNEG